MDIRKAATAFAALGLESRLEILLALAEAGAKGMTAGDIIERLKAKQNSVSSQLKILTQADLITPERQGRRIIYRIDKTTLQAITNLIKA